MTKATPEAINALIDAKNVSDKALLDTSSAKLRLDVAALDWSTAPVVKPPVVTYPTIPALTVGVAMAIVTPTNTGDTATYSGTLPDGLSLDSKTGAISGTPKTTNSGNYKITASNAGGSVSVLVTILVNAPAPPTDNPGGPVTPGATYNNQSNITISNKTFNAAKGDILTFNNCNTVHVTKCIFNNGNVWGCVFNNCQNVTFDFNYGEMLCKMAVAVNCQGVKFDNNQFLNLNEPILYKSDFAHVLQFNNVSGVGNSISGNIIENIYGKAVHPHDLINCYNSAGTKDSPLVVAFNKLRGGMVDGGWPNSGDTGAGITFDNGSFIDCHDNIGVNPGCAFIQTNGTHSDVNVHDNQGVSLIASKVAADGVIALGAKTRVAFSNLRINWLKYNNAHGVYAGGETGFWAGGAFPPAGVTMTNNNWFDQTLTADILPKQILTYHL